MKFQVGDITETLKGDPSLGKTQVSLKSMMKVIKEKGGGSVVGAGKDGS